MSQCYIICSKNIFRLEQHPASTILLRFPVGERYFSLLRTFIPALVPTQPLIRWVPQALPPGVKRPGVWTRTRQSNDRFKNKCTYTPISPYASMAYAGTILHLLHRTVPSHIWISSTFIFNPVVTTNNTQQELLHSDVYNIIRLGDIILYAPWSQTGLKFTMISKVFYIPTDAQ